MDVYIKPYKKVKITAKEALYVKDVADVSSGKDERKAKDTRLFFFSGERKVYLVSALDVARVITTAIPGATVNNLGEINTLVEYAPKPRKESKWLTFVKVGFIACVLFCGSATAIMSFHTDAEIPKIFERYYEIFYDKKEDDPYIINIPYSIGLAVGIAVFFNHFSKRRVTNDPTPIEVQMSLYDDDVTTTKVNALSHNKDAQNYEDSREDGGGGDGNVVN